MLKSYGLAFGITTIASGLIKQVVFYQGSTASHYLVAVSLALLLSMLAAVILSVFWERAWQAPAFICIAGTVNALLFYRPELTAGYQSLAANIVMVIAFTVWVLARIGCYLRRRLRTMDQSVDKGE